MGEPMRYEDAAALVGRLPGWQCAKCKRDHGDDPGSEHSARSCCARDLPCRGEGCDPDFDAEGA